MRNDPAAGLADACGLHIPHESHSIIFLLPSSKSSLARYVSQICQTSFARPARSADVSALPFPADRL